MSGNRIRYVKHPTREECFLSLNQYTSQKTGAKYKIVLDKGNMKFMIRNERSKEFIFTSKEYKNLHVIKRTARKKLENLGVSLGRESRDRQFGLCDKGFTQSKFEEENDK